MSDFARAYESGEVDSDELMTALTRYDSSDADGTAEFDDLLARNGDDAVDFAGRTDSDTFDSTCRCDIRSAPSPMLRAHRGHRDHRCHGTVVAVPPSVVPVPG